MAAVAAVVLCTLPASAQLSVADVAALKARAESASWTFTVGENPATRQPMDALCGLVTPKNWQAGARFMRFAAKADLPAAFDWRAHGGCTPIKNQGGCGSCWAFATVGGLECNIRIKDGDVVNLSEQWLISCNVETELPRVLGGAWGCDGGWFAHDYHAGLKADPCGGSGAVLTAQFPYATTNSACQCPYAHEYAMDGWAYIAGEEAIPDANAIKQAILDYGPVTAAVYVNDAFRGYTGGVFNAGEDEEVNHAIVLVGWDDAQGTNGVWILRNSWTTLWGEGGYMQIEYGCSRVGFGACYVEYAGRGLGIPPAITAQPQPVTVPEGWYCQFSAAAKGVGDLHYAWFHDGEPVGGDAPVLWVEKATPASEGNYVCRVSDARGAVESEPAMLVLDAVHSVPAAGYPALCVLVVALLRCQRGTRKSGLLRRPGYRPPRNDVKVGCRSSE